jgi:Tol biopolymer transport system component
LGWIARDGTVTPIAKEARNYTVPRLSPDGHRIAVVVGEQDKTDIWTYDMQTGTFSRVTSVTAALSPSWSPDGSQIFFLGLGDTQRFAIWSQRADGGSPARKVTDARGLTTQVAIAPDGRSLLYVAYNENSWDIYRVQLDTPRVAVPYLATAANETGATFSPDGRWVALASTESGRQEIYLRSYPDPSSKVQISAGGGGEPVWSADGTRVFYKAGGVLHSAQLSMSPNPRVIARDTVLASISGLVNGGISAGYDVAKDGRFLGMALKKDDYQLVAVPNWRAELAQRLAGSAKR